MISMLEKAISSVIPLQRLRYTTMVSVAVGGLTPLDKSVSQKVSNKFIKGFATTGGVFKHNPNLSTYISYRSGVSAANRCKT